MGWKIAFSFIFFFAAIGLLMVYWFVPISDTKFISLDKKDNSFAGPVDKNKLQFYQNMRFSSSRISYNIEDCQISKSDEMERAFQFIEDRTLLDFYPRNSNAEIKVTCDSKTKVEGELFIAGEGGPINITKIGNFNLISQGKVLLFRESKCPNPNIGLHELLHVLGFDHVQNPNDLMYNVSTCDQTINQETFELINYLYSIPGYPDLVIENVSAAMKGKYLNTNFTIKNDGFVIAPGVSVEIYADEKKIKEVYINPLESGHGKIIGLTNLWVSQFNIDRLKFVVASDFSELKKENNIIVLEVSK
ncbi:hypothetical protein HYT23_03455 [Candidatus Pacearchaeota archaeon]|nr:hypothetical protein [Candidatus Pacearchaeota archaeon]